MASGGIPIGDTLTRGIQNISDLLPLLGTEQCEENIASALTDGFLYAAATPMSIFGSLGVARAGLKAFVAATSIPQLRLDGARILANAGFKPRGKNLSLIMIDKDKKSYCAGNRLQSMMKRLHIKDTNLIAVSSKTLRWNLMMILSTAISCTISITPYIHLNLHANRLSHFVRWTFPVIRAIGGFLTATMIQLLIQSRLSEIMRKEIILNGLDMNKLLGFDISTDDKSLWARCSLDQRCSFLMRRVRHKLASLTIHAPAAPPTYSLNDDTLPENLIPPMIPLPVTPDHSHPTGCVNNNAHKIGQLARETPFAQRIDLETGEKQLVQELESLQKQIIASRGSSVWRGITLILLFIGIIALVAGYIGCFSVVKGAESSGEALIWVALEVGLSVLRVFLWGLNPESDDAPLEFKLKLDKSPPPYTSSAEPSEKERIVPLIRASDANMSYTGLLKAVHWL